MQGHDQSGCGQDGTVLVRRKNQRLLHDVLVSPSQSQQGTLPPLPITGAHLWNRCKCKRAGERGSDAGHEAHTGVVDAAREVYLWLSCKFVAEAT